jgi:uncharacterized protein (DUF608 family)
MCLATLFAQLAYGDTPVARVTVPGSSRPIVGRWLGPAQSESGVPLGGLGTGFIEIRPGARIHDTCLRNNWLKPSPPLLFRLTATIGQGNDARTMHLLAGKDDPAKPVSSRFLGHYPIAEIACDEPATTPASIHLRAFSPFVPQDPELSNTPAAIFTVRITNHDSRILPARISLQIGEPNMDAGSVTPFKTASGEGVQVSTGVASGIAVAGGGTGWRTAGDAPTTPLGDTTARVACTALLKPGEESVVSFAVGWYAPRWTSSDGKTVRNRYAVRFADARGVASFALDRSALIEQKIADWQDDIYRGAAPDWLKDALVNSLYALARNSIYLDDGRLLVNESFTGRAVTESVACRFNSSYPLLMLFPEQEKQSIRTIAKSQAENGEIPFGLGAPLGLESPMFGAQRPILSTEFALMCWRTFALTQDLELLVGLYPRMKKALQYAMTLDTDGDGLINEAPGSETGFPSNQFYDSWPWFGTSSYTAGIGLAALRAGEESARRCGDDEFAGWCRERFTRGAAAYSDLLWTGRYYRLYSDPEGFRQSDTCLANQLCGQTAAWQSGLGDILPFEQVQSALRDVQRINGRGTAGFMSGVDGSGKPDETGGIQSKGVVLSEACAFAAAGLLLAERRQDEALKRGVLETLQRTFDTMAEKGRTWDQPFVLDAASGKPLDGRHYSGNLALWALVYGAKAK